MPHFMKTDNEKRDMNQSAPADSLNPPVNGRTGGIDDEAISFEDLFDLKEIQRLQELFARATGVACQILRPDGTFITERSNYCRLCGDIIRGNEKGLAKCTESDTLLGKLNPGGLNIYRCRSAGLLEAGAPICLDGRHIATWGLGQVCDGTQTEAGIRSYAREIGIDEDAAADAFKDVTFMSRERFEEVARMMHAIANQLATIGYQNLQQARLIEEQKRTKKELARFEWLLEKDSGVSDDTLDVYVPPYSDVTALNTRRVILDAVGKELLASMARDLMDLIETSVAVYEANGDYAYGVFNSSWCRLFDEASFRRCGTDNTKTALHSGKWLCHECCWNESARAAIESGEPTDIECVGGIRLYAVPIRADGEIAGVINIGYGTPPRDDARLQELAEHIGLNIHDVRQASTEYRPRPQYIIDAAKRRCRSVAHHIGEIVQRKRAQTALEEKERQLAVLMGNLPGIAYRRPNKPGWPVAFLSAGCQAITGYLPEELRGDEPPMFEDLIHPDDRQRVCDTVEKHIRKGKLFDLEYRIRDRQGAERWVLEKGRAVGKDADGVAILEGFISEITERKAAETALVREQERLKLASDAAQLGIWDLDLRRNALIWDERMFRLYGVKPEAFGGAYEYWQEGVHPDDLKRASREVDEAIAGEKPFDTEFRVVHPDGSVRHLKAYATVSRDDEGRPVRMTGVNYDITEIKSIQSRLEKQKHMLELVINSAPINIFWKDMDLIYTGCNTKFVASAGKQDMDDIVGNSDLDLIWSGEAQKYLDDDHEVLTTGIPKLNYEENYTLPDGSLVWWRTSKIPLKNGKGDVFGLLAVSEDITEQKQVEKELRNSEKNFRLLFDNSPVGICTVDLLGNFITTNPAYEKMLGYSRQELKEMSFYDVTHPDDRPGNKKLFQEMFSLESTGFNFEKKYIRKDDTEIHVSINATAVLDEKGETIFGTAFAEDITERKLAEIKLTQSKQMMDSIVNSIAEPVFVKDENHCLIMVNDAFCRMIQSRHETLLGKTDYDLFPKKEADIFRERDNLVLESDRPDINEETLTINGQTRILSTSKSSFKNPITGEKNIVGTVRDITEAKSIEEQLRQAQKMESVGRLAGGVAHDFNNMLGIIIGYSELALENVSPDDPLHEDITEIMDAGKRSADITRQLLAFARKQTTAPKILNLNDSIEDMLKMLRRLIGEDIDLAWLPDSNLRPVKIDPSQIDQILANLCVNARDAIAGIGRITIETENVTFDEEYCSYHANFVPGEFVLLAVSDTGCGIAADMLDQIFEPFFTTKELHKGTGLGLSTVYGIVKQNNGFINVYSEPDKGTTFKIYLPRHVELAAGDRKETTREMPVSRGETVLLVEDDPSILKLGAKMLESLGYTVLSANTPNEAVAIAELHVNEIHLLVTDVVMPEMNGRELSEKLQKQHSSLKTLFMSGYTANVIAYRGVLEDGIHFIPKPLSKKELAKKVRDVLDE
ncbi:PAS domain S-box protein [Desulfobacter latus]|uniref:histidine kinase n=1 Tax=Desulfobacter latus TaxID=2292 RepID=A0A850T2L3_9BACT|nr:PAS domain S-box protein [Desulfobacter latus]NWH05963.1 PAS domain S-box protein [Desulfobacter latus]